MILNAHEPFQGGDLYHLYQICLRILTRTHHTGGLILLLILVVELETMAMTLLDMLLAVCLQYLGALFQRTVVSTQTHGTSHIGNVLLLLHQIDHLMCRIRLHLRRVGIRQT